MVREAPAAEPAPFVTAQSTALGLTPAVATLLSTLLLSRLPELLAHSRSKTVTAFAPWSLKDFDWTARVTLASSALSNLRTPVLQLNLTLASPDGRLRQVPLELDRAGLDRVLEQMAKVNAVVQEYETTA
jgi:hypothetical protein